MGSAFRRINLYGGPGSGKSSLAAWIYSWLKEKHLSVELVREKIKPWAYEKRPPQSFDQVYLFGRQLHAEDVFLRNGVEVVVTDSPLLQNVIYGDLYGAPGWEGILSIINEVEELYPSINLVLTYNGMRYDPEGRYQSMDDAVEVLQRTIVLLDDEGHKFDFFTVGDREGAMRYIEGRLGS